MKAALFAFAMTSLLAGCGAPEEPLDPAWVKARASVLVAVASLTDDRPAPNPPKTSHSQAGDACGCKPSCGCAKCVCREIPKYEDIGWEAARRGQALLIACDQPPASLWACRAAAEREGRRLCVVSSAWKDTAGRGFTPGLHRTQVHFGRHTVCGPQGCSKKSLVISH